MSIMSFFQSSGEKGWNFQEYIWLWQVWKTKIHAKKKQELKQCVTLYIHWMYKQIGKKKCDIYYFLIFVLER